MDDDEDIETMLGICCGDTDVVQQHLHTTLRLLNTRLTDHSDGIPNGWDNATDRLEAHLGDLYAPMASVYLHYLDRLDLIEHGCGIAGSWLTSKGVTLLKKLDALEQHA